MKKNTTQIGRNIRNFRENCRIRAQEMADYMDMNLRSYQNIENGTTDITVSRLIQIGQLLRVPIEKLIAAETATGNVSNGTHNNQEDGTEVVHVDKALFDGYIDSLKLRIEKLERELSNAHEEKKLLLSIIAQNSKGTRNIE